MIVPPENFDIRYSEQDDLPILRSWFAPPQERYPFPFQTDEETDLVLGNWIGFYRYKAALTGMLGSEPCAMGTLLLMPYRKVAHHASFFVIVDAQHRRKGIGTSMILNLLHLAKTRFSLEGVAVEVYEPNPILSILEKNQFPVFARQDNFIKINGQGHARILMERFL